MDLPTPTTHSFFVEPLELASTQDELSLVSGAPPTVASFFDIPGTPTPDVGSTPTPFPTRDVFLATPVLNEDQISSEEIFSEDLNPDWTVITSDGMEVEIENTEIAHSGGRSIAFVPSGETSSISLVVREGAQRIYRRDQVLGVRFWMNPGDGLVEPDDLTVSVVGSNAVPHWSENDLSVTNSVDPVFPETRLYYLGFNRSVPKSTWVEVEVWLDSLIYDPIYTYVTGIAIKNDPDLQSKVYLDDVQILMLADEESASADLPDEAADTQPTPTPLSEADGPDASPAPETPALAETTAADVSGTPTPSDVVVHVVRPGESFGLISQQYDTTLEVIQIVNGLFPESKLQLDQVLVIIPGKKDTTSLPRYDAIRVEENTSVEDIAGQYNVPVAELLLINGLEVNSVVPAGTWLAIPVVES